MSVLTNGIDRFAGLGAWAGATGSGAGVVGSRMAGTRSGKPHSLRTRNAPWPAVKPLHSHASSRPQAFARPKITNLSVVS